MTPPKFSGPGLQTDEDFNLKLMESKALRKKAQDDARLLQNRVQLLQIEEKKALKKIEETQKKAQEIQDLKQRNFDMQMRKEEMARKKQEEFERKNLRNRMMKEQLEHKTHYSRSAHTSKVRDDANKTKDLIKDSKMEAKMMNNELMDKNSRLIEFIRKGKDDLQLKKRMNQEKIKEMARKEYEEKIKNEMAIKDSTENQITLLERQENELIERLKNTQLKQKEVFENLEKAITTFPTRKIQ